MVVTLLLSAVVFSLLVVVVVRKALRDRREQRSARRRAALAVALRDGAGHDVLDAAHAGAHAQTDLLAALGTVLHEDGPVRVPPADTPALVAVLQVRMGARDPSARARAALLAGRLGLAPLTAALASLLPDRDPDVRLAACSALAALRTEAAAAALVAALSDGKVQPLRIVERLGYPAAVPVLLAALHEPGFARPYVVRALGLAGDARAAGPVAVLLQTGTVEERISAARTLGQLGDASGRTALLGGLADEAWEVRTQAAKALGTAPDAEAVRLLEAAVGDHNWWVRTNAAGALGAAGAAGVAALRRIAAGDDDYAAERAREALDLCSRQRQGRPAIDA